MLIFPGRHKNTRNSCKLTFLVPSTSTNDWNEKLLAKLTVEAIKERDAPPPFEVKNIMILIILVDRFFFLLNLEATVVTIWEWNLFLFYSPSAA